MKNIYVFFVFISILNFISIPKSYSQSEVEPWGNITGIRVQGQLMEFESSIRVVSKDWKHQSATHKEVQQPKYERRGNTQIVTTTIDSLHFMETVEDESSNKSNITVDYKSTADANLAGVYFCVKLPYSYYAKGSIKINGHQAGLLSQAITRKQGYNVQTLNVIAPERQLKCTFETTEQVLLKKDTANSNDIIVYIPIHTGDTNKGDEATKSFTIEASGKIDQTPIILTLNASQQGRPFAGLGGNFRLQNAKTDPQVIDYCLENLRVAYSRVELPWRFWQPEQNADPKAAAREGKMHPAVIKAMEMAQRLNQKGIPVILSAWAPPAWAVVGEPKFRPVNGIWGNPLDKRKMQDIYKSITDYILTLKENYGVEVKFFSFNESDLGINIRMTGEEHDEFIKGLGAYVVSKGLQTKMLLGDNSDATTYKFIYPALNDPQARPYIGAVSFHSWRGWETGILQKWADAAKQINVPLIVAEGSIDAAAWNYPEIFEEQTYALKEISLYTRLLSICQPLSILQWQLTADYSPLAGGGIFGNNDPLHPTQRFWNLKQLSSTPENLFAMPITANRPNITCAALGDKNKGTYAIHLVNTGTTRDVTLNGFPQRAKQLKVYVTDKNRNMRLVGTLTPSQGKVQFKLDSQSYTTLISQ